MNWWLHFIDFADVPCTRHACGSNRRERFPFNKKSHEPVWAAIPYGKARIWKDRSNTQDDWSMTTFYVVQKIICVFAVSPTIQSNSRYSYSRSFNDFVTRLNTDRAHFILWRNMKLSATISPYCKAKWLKGLKIILAVFFYPGHLPWWHLKLVAQQTPLTTYQQ